VDLQPSPAPVVTDEGPVRAGTTEPEALIGYAFSPGAGRFRVWTGTDHPHQPHPHKIESEAGPGFALVSLGVEPPAGIEPATPSLPSMVGPFGGQRGTSLRSLELQVAGLIDDREMGCGEAACGTAAGKSLARSPVGCPVVASREGFEPPNRQIRSLVLYVDLVGSRRIWPAHVDCLVGPDGSRRIPSDRPDDQTDD
jgi:hypothetical protein